jgi:hypothetical protein
MSPGAFVVPSPYSTLAVFLMGKKCLGRPRAAGFWAAGFFYRPILGNSGVMLRRLIASGRPDEPRRNVDVQGELIALWGKGSPLLLRDILAQERTAIARFCTALLRPRIASHSLSCVRRVCGGGSRLVTLWVRSAWHAR